jgi:hypothetical protein
MNQINKTFEIKYVNGHTEISILSKLSRNGQVIYKTTRDGKMIGAGSGLWYDMQHRFSALRKYTEEEFLQVLGVNKAEMSTF